MSTQITVTGKPYTRQITAAQLVAYLHAAGWEERPYMALFNDSGPHLFRWQDRSVYFADSWFADRQHAHITHAINTIAAIANVHPADVLDAIAAHRYALGSPRPASTSARLSRPLGHPLCGRCGWTNAQDPGHDPDGPALDSIPAEVCDGICGNRAPHPVGPDGYCEERETMPAPLTTFDAALRHVRSAVPHMGLPWCILHCVIEKEGADTETWERYAATWTMEETTEAFALLAGFTFILALTE
jgi:hypothetical protein